MKDKAPIVDAIDERNFKDELKRTVIKRSRVHFVTKEELLQIEEEPGTDMLLSSNDSFYENSMYEHDDYSGDGMDEIDLSDVDPEALAKADEIFKRLKMEAEEDAKATEEEWTEKILSDMGKSYSDDAYNPSTCSYSGYYGKGDISDTTLEQASKILSKKNEDMAALIAAEQEKDG